MKSSLRRIQNPVKAGNGDSFENNQPLQAVNYFFKKLYPRRVTSNLKQIAHFGKKTPSSSFDYYKRVT